MHHPLSVHLQSSLSLHGLRIGSSHTCHLSQHACLAGGHSFDGDDGGSRSPHVPPGSSSARIQAQSASQRAGCAHGRWPGSGTNSGHGGRCRAPHCEGCACLHPLSGRGRDRERGFCHLFAHAVDCIKQARRKRLHKDGQAPSNSRALLRPGVLLRCRGRASRKPCITTTPINVHAQPCAETLNCSGQLTGPAQHTAQPQPAAPIAALPSACSIDAWMG